MKKGSVVLFSNLDFINKRGIILDKILKNGNTAYLVFVDEIDFLPIIWPEHIIKVL